MNEYEMTQSTVLLVAAIMAICMPAAHADQGGAMTVASSTPSKPDVGAPEAVTFLMLALHAAEQHKKKYGAYPSEWHQMDFAYANGPYNKNDAGLRATAQDGKVWHPKKGNYSYEIAAATKDEFLIRAVSATGKVEYEIKNGQVKPTLL
jgi:hypothetical protein